MTEKKEKVLRIRTSRAFLWVSHAPSIPFLESIEGFEPSTSSLPDASSQTSALPIELYAFHYKACNFYEVTSFERLLSSFEDKKKKPVKYSRALTHSSIHVSQDLYIG